MSGVGCTRSALTRAHFQGGGRGFCAEPGRRSLGGPWAEGLDMGCPPPAALGRMLGSWAPKPLTGTPSQPRAEGAGLTRTMWPVEMSMLGCTGSSDQDEVLPRAEGLGIGPSLNWEDTLLTRDVCAVSGRSDGRAAMRCRHSSCKTAGAGQSLPTCVPRARADGIHP